MKRILFTLVAFLSLLTFISGLECQEGYGTSNPIQNPSIKTCSGPDARCARISAQATMYFAANGRSIPISGEAVFCTQQSKCDSWKDQNVCKTAAAVALFNNAPLPISANQISTCDTACCNTHNCNGQSMAAMRTSGSQSSTVTTATQPMTPVTPPMPPATPPMLPATASMTNANTRTPTTIAGTSGKPPVPTTTGNRQVATVPSMLPNTVNPTFGNAKTTNPLITRVLPSIEWDPSTMIQVSVNPQPATFATGSSSQMEPPNSTDSSVQHKNSTGPSGNRAFESTTSDSSVAVGGFKLCVLIALIAMFNAEL